MKKYAIFILIAILLCSCGTHQRTINLEKVNEISERLKRIETQNDITANVKLTKQANVTTLTPLDPTKPSSYNGKTFDNAKVVIDHTKTDSVANNTDRTKTNELERTETEVKTKNKDVETKTTKPNPYLWMGLTSLLIVVAYLVYKVVIGRRGGIGLFP